ncbi:amidase [Bradyrhizobium sp. LHD-71]|uniref:amidase n=1 Tax=Bradyrhizobium sp. LHD-71 TaxID=3072141 RepID=UPI00280F1F95|nr:amidase [Bradyrhizobium sp. LHD-71]MDQ8728869.1 amidase [Bradyrhizobium sp. LHD-71]
MADTALHDLTLAEAAPLVRARKLSPVEYANALLSRTDALEPQLNAYITRTSEAAIEAARAAEAEIARGNWRGPLHGIPFAVKDIYDTAGVLTSGHSRTCIDRVPDKDATAVARLRAAGAVLMGKLATHEFAHGGPSFDLPWPPARNPWNTAHFTGGSSSGSGAAIAAGLVPVSLGSDTGGSIRGPAGLCGIAGLKPTYGLVSRAGVLPNSYSYDHCGPMARTSEDCALILNAIAGNDPADPASAKGQARDFTAGIDLGVKGLRIGVVRHFWERDLTVHAEVPAAMAAAISTFREMGAIVEDVALRPLQSYSDVKIVTAESELFSLHLPELIARPEQFGQDFRARSLAACLFTAEDYVRASRERRAILAEMHPLYRRYDLFLTANTSAAPRLDRHDTLSFWTRPNLTSPFNCTGGPALAILCGFTNEGLPLSMQIAGRPFDDARVLRAGHAFERATGFYRRRPSLVPGTRPGAVDPKPWSPDTSSVEPAVRVLAENAARHAGLRLSDPVLEELVAVAPSALALARRLRRDHPREAEVASIFDPAD